MPLQFPSPGPNYVPEYQMAAVPWATSSITPVGAGAAGVNRHDFYRLTSWVTVVNNHDANDLQVGFTEAGILATLDSNFFEVPPDSSVNLFLRLKTIYISGSAGATDYSIVAGTTGILPNMQLAYTGSAGYEGVG